MAAAACGCRRVVARAALYPIWQRHGKVGLGKHLQARPGGRHCAALIRAAVRKSHGDGVHLAGDLVGPLRAAISKCVYLVSSHVTSLHNGTGACVGGSSVPGEPGEKGQEYRAHCVAVTCRIRTAWAQGVGRAAASALLRCAQAHVHQADVAVQIKEEVAGLDIPVRERWLEHGGIGSMQVLLCDECVRETARLRTCTLFLSSSPCMCACACVHTPSP